MITNIIRCVTFLLLVSTYQVSAQNFRYDWTNPLGSNNSEDGKDVAIASDNSVYVVGQFMSNIDFDPGPGNTTYSVTVASGYIAHYAANGSFINVIPLLGQQSSNCYGVEIDDSNNIYVSGVFSGSLDFDPSAAAYILTASGTADIFVAKYNSVHQLVWVRKYGGTLNSFNHDLEYTNGRLALNGRYNGTINFAPGNSVTAVGGTDIYAMSIDRNGNFLWAKSFGNAGNEDTRCICFDDSKNVYLAGSFVGTLDVDPSNTVTQNIISNGTNGGDVFLLKLDSAGNFVWVKTLNGGGAEFIFDVKTRNGLLYVNGGFSWTVDFDPSANYDTLTNTGGIDAFAWQLDLNGNHKWVRTVGNGNFDFYDGRTIAFSKTGEPYFLGIFEGTANFNPQGNFPMSSNGAFDFYVWALDQNGNFKWAQSVGGPSEDIGLGIATDNLDNIVLCGFFRNTVDFNPWAGVHSIAAVPSGANNLPDAFLSKWRVCESNKSINVNSCTSPYFWNSTNYSTPGTYTGTFLNVDSCDSTVVLNLTFTKIDTSVSINQQSLTAQQNGASYQWLNCDGWQIIPNATQQTFTSNAGGNFAVQITSNGCIDTSNCIALNALHLNEWKPDHEFSIWPNPAHSQLFFSSAANIKSLQINSIDGKCLYDTEKIPKSIDLTTWPTGTYFIIVKNEYNKILSRKLIISSL